MPYIKQEVKDQLEAGRYPSHPGELNYLITQLLIQYWRKSAENYEAINSIIGAVECAKTEFYRRIAVPYENEKIRQNGDVYDVSL